MIEKVKIIKWIMIVKKYDWVDYLRYFDEIIILHFKEFDFFCIFFFQIYIFN